MSRIHSDNCAPTYSRRHVCVGWWWLFLFLSLGMALELLHLFKVGWYLDDSNEMRRTMWRLAHAHGTLLGVVNIAFGLTTARFVGKDKRWPRFVSPCLVGASVLLPGGFFLGGLYHYGGDPGLGVLLVPAGAALLFAAVLVTALRATSRGVPTEPGDEEDSSSAPERREKSPDPPGAAPAKKEADARNEVPPARSKSRRKRKRGGMN